VVGTTLLTVAPYMYGDIVRNALFQLRIKLGNAAMHQPEHVADVLEQVAHNLRTQGFTPDKPNILRDLNGNTVGKVQYHGG